MFVTTTKKKKKGKKKNTFKGLFNTFLDGFQKFYPAIRDCIKRHQYDK